MNQKRKTIYLLYLICVIIIGFSIYFIVRNNTPKTPSIQAYLKKVYPLLPQNAATPHLYDQLDFYYYPYPPLNNNIRTNVPLNPLPKLNTLYCLSWMYACGNTTDGVIFKNLYPPFQTNKFRYINGIPSDHYAEVMHFGWYNEPGLYFYVAKGTGIFLNVGHTLIARNKIEALKKLGLTNMQIFSYVSKYVYPYPHFTYEPTYAAVKQYAEEKHLTLSGSLAKIFKSAINNTDYNFNRMADSANYDVPLYLLCRQHHYDTIQLTAQPNDNGGWAYELIDCRTSFELPLIKRWQLESHYLSIRNPLNLKQFKPCHYHTPFEKHLYCHK